MRRGCALSLAALAFSCRTSIAAARVFNVEDPAATSESSCVGFLPIKPGSWTHDYSQEILETVKRADCAELGVLAYRDQVALVWPYHLQPEGERCYLIQFFDPPAQMLLDAAEGKTFREIDRRLEGMPADDWIPIVEEDARQTRPACGALDLSFKPRKLSTSLIGAGRTRVDPGAAVKTAARAIVSRLTRFLRRLRPEEARP
ncbi:MAG: hypothetical protein HY078_17650 [Elusimicrobia bacterium]|nr:hypothetical protein [Elusimicrobiota bacterium]